MFVFVDMYLRVKSLWDRGSIVNGREKDKTGFDFVVTLDSYPSAASIF